MGNAGADQLIDNFVDMLYAETKRGKTLDAAVANLERFFSDGSQLQALRAAAERIRRQVEGIEHLRRPTALRKTGRIAWYPGPRDIDDFWPALQRYLLDAKQWPSTVVESINNSSNRVISCLDFPGNPRFSTRGLVVGYVQSGKTANFTAVISKAADIGFRVILILSGVTNSLRRQTQERLDKELIALNQARWHTWTDVNSDIGDFPFNVDAMLNPNQRNIAVVKKNGPRLRRLLRMLKRADRALLAQCPVLIIDDECDQASVNATGNPDRVTAINQLLRNLLAELPRVAYVGYTATPYANVLIDPTYDADLYPRDFIVALPIPPDYFGAERLFGRDLLDADPVPVAQQGLDMIRDIELDEVELLRPPNRERKNDFIMTITPSLEGAIRYYWLATAAKAVRGLAAEHSCMLIHTTVYAQTHLNAQPVVEGYIRSLAQRIDANDAALLDELEKLWDEEQERLPSALLDRTPVSFQELRPHLAGMSALPEVPVENSFSDERIDFSRPGRRYIVIGGNVLARGLTIEGLVVSFFVRTASQYDTLMQMGRWFGYRTDYEDLPRIWMTDDMAGYFKEMATVEAEIRRDIEAYERENITPLDFAVRIRRIPGLDITARGKMARAVECQVSFADEHIQTRKFYERNTAWLARNWQAASDLIDAIRDRREARVEPSIVFTDVPFIEITRFLDTYQAHEAHEQFAPGRLKEYIARQNDREPGSLARWNVAVISTDSGIESEFPLGALGRVRTVNRAKLNYGTDADIKALMSRGDALVDMPGVQLQPGAGWDQIKDARAAHFHPGRALLLLYPIYRYSIPQRTSSEKLREGLAASRDVLGVGIVFPRPIAPVPLSYVRAPIDLTRFEQAEYEEERLPDDENVA